MPLDMERLEEIREENFADALEIENDVRRLAIPGISEPALGLSGSIIAAQMLDWDEADVEEYFNSLGQTVPLLSLDTLLGRLAAHTTLCVREARSLDAHVVAALRQPDKWGLLFDGLFPHMESISAQATPDLRVFGAFSVLLSGGACGSERRVVSVSAPKLAHADDASEMVVVIFGFGGSDADQLQLWAKLYAAMRPTWRLVLVTHCAFYKSTRGPPYLRQLALETLDRLYAAIFPPARVGMVPPPLLG